MENNKVSLSDKYIITFIVVNILLYLIHLGLSFFWNIKGGDVKMIIYTNAIVGGVKSISYFLIPLVIKKPTLKIVGIVLVSITVFVSIGFNIYSLVSSR